MRNYKRVVIAGVGLLGGSIGLGLRQRGLAESLVGWGRNLEKLKVAQSAGAIDEISDDLALACSEADLVVVCTPVQLVPDVAVTASRVAPKALITDVGSTKAKIAKQLEEVPNFCGAHPLAGGEKSGSEHASPDLFCGRTCVITATETTSHAIQLRTEQFWEGLGAKIIGMSPEQHDSALAMTSHLPHVIASCLAGVTPSELLPLAATGWSDTTRVAAGGVELWEQIIAQNQQPILKALQQFQAGLEEWVEAIEADDQQKLIELLRTGKQIRDSLGN
ncbi:MAG: prephenate dehydrogenase/arogenate dehydrogenase family protein [Planctomycetota bacterium]